MKILALDSSGLTASAAIIENESMLAEYTINYKKTHSQTLLPMLNAIVEMTELDLKTVDAIAVAGGPGSFTGLRIGSATAKGLGLALDKPIISVPTVDGLAYNLSGCQGVVCPLMDARRNQVYTGIYRFEKDKMIIQESQCAVAIEEIVAKLNALNQEVAFLGDGVPVYSDVLEKELRVPFWYAPAHLNRQRAGAIGTLAAIYWKEGKMQDAALHKPDYLRLSQAERERMEREQKND